MTTITPKKLRACYSYMFAGPDIGISIPRGWMEIFARLCEDIDQSLGTDRQGFHFTQCKEKFGSARWYWSMQGRQSGFRIDLISEAGTVTGLVLAAKSHESAPDSAPELVREPVPIDSRPDARRSDYGRAMSEHIAELVDAATEQTHQACIVCGSRARGDAHGGWMLMLCETHAAQRRRDKLPNFWFEGDEA